MLARDLLNYLREGYPLAPEAINGFAKDLGNGRVTDAQAGAFAMAVCLHGLDDAARVALT